VKQLRVERTRLPEWLAIGSTFEKKVCRQRRRQAPTADPRKTREEQRDAGRLRDPDSGLLANSSGGDFDCRPVACRER